MSAPSTEWYRFGDGYLGIDSTDLEFRDRYRLVFSDCAARGSPPTASPSVLCRVRGLPPDLTVVDFDDPQPLDAGRFAIELFADRTYRLVDERRDGSIVQLTPDDSDPVVFTGTTAIAATDGGWRALLGNLALNRVLRLQSDTLFLHAASVSIGGRGALLSAPKEGGKTTLSTALAARGHGFLGDELAAVRLSVGELIPFRRAISFREGPRSRAVDEALDARPELIRETYPDGEPRRRGVASSLFPEAAADVTPLAAIFVLESFGARASVEPFRPAAADARLLAPFASSLWGVPTALRAMRIGKLMASVPCFRVESGSPDETADLIEETMEAGWH